MVLLEGANPHGGNLNIVHDCSYPSGFSFFSSPVLLSQKGNSLTFGMWVLMIMSHNFLRLPNNQTKFFKDPN